MTHLRTWAAGLITATLAVTLAACGGGGDKPDPQAQVDVTAPTGDVVERSRRDQVAIERRERDRQKVAAKNEEDFSFFRYRIDVSEDTPEACLIFSSALDPDVDYATFVEFRGTARPALSVEGRELCVGGLEFGETKTAVLKSGLPADDGRALEFEEEVSIDFEDRPPYVGFKGAGVILPRLEADGLPIETVNVDDVKVTVSRVNDRALFLKRVGQGETTAQGRYSYNYGENDPDDMSTEIWSGTMAVERVQNSPVVTVFPLADVIGKFEPGSYYVRVEDGRELSGRDGPPAASQRWIMMTDLALSAYRGEHGLDVTLRSLQTGRAMPTLKVQLIARNNEVLAESQTDGDGRVQFDKPIMAGNGNASPKLVMAFGADGDLGVLDLTRASVDLTSEEVGGRRTPGEIDSYLYTERGIYRPGETVHITGMMRDRAAVSVEGRSGSLIITRPNGMEAAKIRFDDPESAAVLHDYDLSKSAARGIWRATLVVDGIGNTGSVSWSVEDFVPQRIKVEVTGDDSPVGRSEIRELQVDSRFLYGAPGAGLTVKAQARIEPDPSPFDKFKGFTFGDRSSSFRERIIELQDQTTDGAGSAVIPVDVGGVGNGSDRPLRINFVADVLEPGGRSVSDSLRIPYRPQDTYIGIKPDFEGRPKEGESATFEIAAVGADGEGQSQRMSWKVIEIDYHYDWYKDGERWRWRRSRTVRTLNEGVANAPAGGSTSVSVEGLGWGEHILTVETEDGQKATRSFYAGWGGRISDDGVEAPDRVKVSAPVEAPRAGRNAEVEIMPPYDGEAQIVVATDRILSVQTRPVSADGTTISLPVTEEWGEGAYVMVSVFSPRDPVLQAKPRRAVGVGYIETDVSRRTYNLTIDAPDMVRPRREQLITVNIEDGPKEPVYLTLAAVDEGILQLTKFQSPDPVSYFFGKKALGVGLYDDYGRLLDPNMGMPAEVRTGGDQLGGEGLSVVPTKTVALFSGLVDVGRNGKAQVRFDLPDFNGELRLMAVAWSETGLGAASQPMTVRDPVPAELIMPRFLAPGDEAFVTASIDNVELDGGTFTANVVADGPMNVIAGNLSTTLDKGERKDSAIRVEADAQGISRLRLNVEGPGNYAVDHQYLIQTRSPYLPVTRVEKTLMQPGDSFAASSALLDGLVPGSSAVTVSYSTLPVDAGALYASLSRYPYGCTEQTVSVAMPLLYSEQLVAMGATGDRREGARTKVQQAVDTILNRQSSEGAFGLWREGDRYATPWLGAYATDFILRAKQQGYVVPQESLDRAYGALRQIASADEWRIYGYDTDVWESRWHEDTTEKLLERSAPFALYVLAKAGEADISRARYLHDRELDSIDSPLARAHLGAALAAMGDRSRAKSAFDAAEEALGYNNDGDYYQTRFRDLAAVLSLAAESDMTEHVISLTEKLGEDVKDPDRLTTQEKVFTLLAVNGLTKGDENISLKTEGLGRGSDNERRYQLTEEQVGEGVSFELRGKAPVFRTVLVQGAPIDAPPAASENLKVSKTVYTLQGGKTDLGSVKQGDQFVIAIRLRPEENRVNPIIVADLLPAGFEIETILTPRDGDRGRRDDGAFAWLGSISKGRVAEARDDQFVAAIDLRDDSRTLAYVVRAVTPGDFAIPGVQAEDMYRPEVFARSPAGRVTVTPLQGTTGGAQ